MGRGPRRYPPGNPIGGFINGIPGREPYNANAVFVKLQRNKKSIALDLKSIEGRSVFLELVKVADVVMENFSSRAMARLKLNYEHLKKINPKIIHIAMPGYGLTGPYRDRVAFGPTVEPMSGLHFAMGYGEHEPRATAMAIPDPISAVNATAALMTALQRRKQTGKGLLLEMSLHESAVSYSGPWLIEHQLDRQIERNNNRHPEMVPHGIYPCAGRDNWLAIACSCEEDWQALCRLTQGELNASWDINTRHDQHDQIDNILSNWTVQLQIEDALMILQNEGIPSGIVSNTAQMAANPQVIERGFFVPIENGVPMPGNPIKMKSISSEDWTPSPKLGEHNHEVLAEWLGYSDEQVQHLYDQKIIVDQPPI